MYDVTIVGAGPAGAVLASLLGRHFKIALIDRRHFAENKMEHFRKVCGGLLAPDAQKELVKLERAVPKSVLVDPQIFAVKTIDLESRIESLHQKFYFNVDREKFDSWMVSFVPERVDRFFGAIYKGYEKEGDTYRIHISNEKKKEVLETRFLIGADGGFSLVRRQAFPEIPLPQLYVSIQEWYRNPPPYSYYTALFDARETDFYGWTIPKEDYLVLGAALPVDNARVRFERMRERFREYGPGLGEFVLREGIYLARPMKNRQVFEGKGGIGLIGEAAGLISPSSAEGISFAIRSAVNFAETMLSGIGDPIGSYRRKNRKLHRKIRERRMKARAMFSPLLRRIGIPLAGFQVKPIDKGKTGKK